ncbi:MAG: hypothetical protein Q7T55_04475 [Solirubrobacteraceae bacterium]|nr:hypothetical protein [Solirubrobacteraceae bacterium]
MPDYPVARLEGVNGIGKSVTVRLLELCSGQRPDLTLDQWVGFCEALGTVEVAATNLLECDSIRWVVSGETLLARSELEDPAVAEVLARRAEAADGRRRPASPEPGRQRHALPTLEWFEELSIDGTSAESVAQLRKLLVVERIGGDTGLVRTIATYSEEQGELAAAELDNRLPFDLADNAARLIEGVSELLVGVDVDLVRSRAQANRATTATLAEATTALDIALADVRTVRRLVELQQRLERTSQDRPSLDARISEADEQIVQLEKAEQAIGSRIAALEKELAGTDEVKKDLKSAERSLKYQTTRIGNLTRDTATDFRTAGIDKAEQLVQRTAELRRAIRDTTQARDALDAGPAIEELVELLLPPVSERQDAGLGEQLLIPDGESGERGLTVSDTVTGLNRRRQMLKGPTDDDAVAGLNDRLARDRRALEACQRLPSQLSQLSSARDARDAAEKKQTAAVKRLEEPAAAKLEAEISARREAIEAVVAAVTKRALLIQEREELGSDDEIGAAERELSLGLQQLSIERSELVAHFQLLSTAAKAAEDLRTARARDAEETASALARAVAEVDAAVDALRDANNSWLSIAGVSAPENTADLEERLAFVERLAPALTRAGASLEVRQLGFQVRAAVQQVVSDLVGRGDLGIRTARVAAARLSLERYAASQFEVPEVREPLLGSGAHSLEMNFVEKSLEWLDGDGQKHKRPLEGFSSGEQAFGFTQARLALASGASQSAANQLIALDEFGAFVSGQRLRALRTFLESWSHRRKGIQLILILPARDFEDLANRAAPRERERYVRLGEKMKDPGYLVEPLGAP